MLKHSLLLRNFIIYKNTVLEDIGRVFDKGFTGINGRNRLYKSTGMGLYFAKNMIDKLGHKIEVSSKKDEYTIFNIYFYDISDYLSN